MAVIDGREVLNALGIEWTERGERLMFLCPIHGDTDPSGCVWVDEGRYFCFGCEEQGDLIDLWARTRGVAKERAAEEMSTALGRPVAPVPAVNMEPALAVKAIMESRLEDLKDRGISMEVHAKLGERIEKTIWAYRKRKITSAQLDGALTRFLLETETIGGIGVS